ncbi:hypothetical protein Tco_1048038 [Tanacetum coccineum]
MTGRTSAWKALSLDVLQASFSISDLKLPLTYMYSQEKLPVTLSPLQAFALLVMGLQNQDDTYLMLCDGDLKEAHLPSLVIMFFGVKDYECYEERLLQVFGTTKYDKGDTTNASSEQ